MSNPFSHAILVVDDDESAGNAITRLVSQNGVQVTWVASGEEGIETINRADQPFSIIISGQRMPGMQGPEFLREAAELSPDSIRFLVTGYDAVSSIIDAVNQGRVNKIIQKPWDDSQLMDTIYQSLGQYELVYEEVKLLKIAKKQNEKLYLLKKELMENVQTHIQKIADLDAKVRALGKTLENQRLVPEEKKELGWRKIEQMIQQKNRLDQEGVNKIYLQVLGEVVDQLAGISSRNTIPLTDEELWN